MAKNLVVCCDGTGNQFGDANSNVVKLFSVLQSDDRQLAFYDAGVGTFGLREALFEWQKVPAKIFGLAFGWGVTRNVENAYRFLMQHYQPGDRIFLFGFSRGAYVVRALAGMLHAVGLLHPQHENLIEYASRLYQQLPSKESRVAAFFGLQRKFKTTFARECPVNFMGLWDTVTSVGWIYTFTRFPYTTHNPGVHTVRHAVSIDERRCKFRQNLWSPSKAQDAREVWFAGVHSDVGGGYPESESALAKIPLEWMARQAKAHGLQIDAKALDNMLGADKEHVKPDAAGDMHRSLHGFWWWLLEFFPRLYKDAKNHFETKLRLPFLRWSYLGRPRFIPPQAIVHESVLRRQKADIGYAPPNLPLPIAFVEEENGPVRVPVVTGTLIQRIIPGIGLGSRAPSAAVSILESPISAKRLAYVLSEEAVHEQRNAQCDIFELEGSRRFVTALSAQTRYRAHIYIGKPLRFTTLTVAEPLDEDSLPPSKDGHTLRIIFCPLSKLWDRQVPPQEFTVHLPTHGNSTRAPFDFATDSQPQNFRARILVLHETRILQTLMLSCDVGCNLDFEEENTLASTIETAADSTAEPVDVALLINDNPAGIPGLTAITADRAVFLEPDGLARSIRLVRDLLGTLNQRIDGVSRLDDAALVDVLKDLANHGVVILREVAAQLPIGFLQQARRVQLVEAVRSAYFPVEFLYNGKAPAPNATLCPNAVAALKDTSGNTHAQCQYKGSREHVCPYSFWGFSKCIERQPFGLEAGHVFSIPQRDADSIEPFLNSVYAASRRVDETELTSPSGMESVLKQSIRSVLRARSWDELRTQVGTKQPTFLLLLPHSLSSPDTIGMPALEISGTNLRASDLDEDYVNPQASAVGPIVMLLGCSTALTEIPFLNFVREFKRSGASIVLGTLAIIHGSKAVAFVERFFAELHDLPAGQTLAFDELLRQVKCEMLAEGEPFVLSLAAYGHSGWKLKI